MSIESLFKKLCRMLETAIEDRDSHWAYDACKLSREITEDILECYAPSDKVKEIIPKLEQLKDSVEQLKLNDDFWAPYLPEFAANIGWRISKLKKYAEERAKGTPVSGMVTALDS